MREIGQMSILPPCPPGTNDPIVSQQRDLLERKERKQAFRAEAEEAHRRYASYIQETPLLPFDDLSTSNQKVWVKCENLQKTGSFKARGAMSACQHLLATNPNATTVVTHSSGNFAQALAWAAGRLGLIAEIVMPDNAPAAKVAGVRKWKGKITFSESTQAAREAAAAKIVAETGGEFMHPYNDARVIRGQASIAIEIEKQMATMNSGPNTDLIVVPIGGGGMISGIASYTSARVVGAEPDMANDASRSKVGNTQVFNEGYPLTVADGLRTNLGSLTWPVVRDVVEDIITVDEASIVAGTKEVHSTLKLMIEPSAGVGVAAWRKDGVAARYDTGRTQNIVIILCGGNLDLEKFYDTYK